MKSVKISIFVLSTILAGVLTFVGCSNDLNSNNGLETQKREGLISDLVIDEEEAPDIEELKLTENWGITDITYDTSREVILDTENSVVIVPIRGDIDLNETYPPIALAIKIAKKNVKPDSGCKSCVDCIGFRCKPNKPVNPALTDVEEAEEGLLAKIASPASTEREQDFYVFINLTDFVLEYHSKQNIDWSSM